MTALAASICLLAVVTTATARLFQTERYTNRLPPVTMTYAKPTAYPCMQDWNKVCRTDKDCCSGSCLTHFCKVVGIEMTTPSRRRNNRPRIVINITK